MELAYRTNVSVINRLSNAVTKQQIQQFKNKKSAFKAKIKPLAIPTDGIIKADTLKDTYFPSSLFDGTDYDVFISHSHNNKDEAILLAAWLENTKQISCFVDSFVWGSADELLREIDDKYCYQKHKKTYNYNKRNFTTSHIHAILSMALLDTIQRSRYCIFIESSESVQLTSKLKKETLSPWLYEEIKYMQLFQPERNTKFFTESIEKAVRNCKVAYDITDICTFPFLDFEALTHFL